MKENKNPEIKIGDIVVNITRPTFHTVMPEFFKVTAIIEEVRTFNYEVATLTGKKIEFQHLASKIVSSEHNGMWGTLVPEPEDEVRNLNLPESVPGADKKIEGVIKESGEIIMLNIPNNAYVCKKWDGEPEYFNVFG